MSVASFSDLKTAVASFLHRDDLTSTIPDFITLAESELQIRCKLMEFESTATIVLSSGSGTLPTDFVGMRSLYWDGNTKQALTYISPDRFDSLRNNSGGTPGFYTISGTTLRLNEGASGNAIATYNARFTVLSDSNTTNSLLTNYPDAYLYGALKHACIYTQDDAGIQKYGVLFNAACDRVISNNKDRKYAGPLQVRPR